MLDQIVDRLCVTAILKAIAWVCPPLSKWLKDLWERRKSHISSLGTSTPSDFLKEDLNHFRSYVEDLLFEKVQARWRWMETVFGYEPTDFNHSCPKCRESLKLIPNKDMSDCPVKIPSASCIYPPPYEYSKLICEKCDRVIYKYHGTPESMEEEFKKEILRIAKLGDGETDSKLVG